MTTVTNDVYSVLAEQSTAFVNEANGLVDKIVANSSDNKGLVHQIREDVETDDEKILEYRANMEAANAEILAWQTEIDSYIVANKVESPDSDFNVDAAKERYAELKKSVNAIKTMAGKLPGFTDESLKDVPALKTLRGGTSSGSGAGGKRPRLQNTWLGDMAGKTWRRVFDTVEQPDKTVKDVSTFTLLARELNKVDNASVTTKDLQEAAFAAANTEDLSTKAGEVIEFSFTPKAASADKSAPETVMIRVQPVDKDAAEVAPVVTA